MAASVTPQAAADPTPRRVVVFVGPTISPAEVHAVLSDAQVRPPAARGDLFADEWRPGDVAVIVDGYFRERRSVGHKEILWLLGEGVDVVGVASMGALRAAELAPCGMRGLGAVYAMYADGEIDGDDEVGVLHGPAAKGYPPLSVALVNLRYGCREGVETEAIPAESASCILEAAKALPFPWRTWADLRKHVDEAHHDALDTLEGLIDSGVWDLKRRDTLAALATLAAGTGTVADAAADTAAESEPPGGTAAEAPVPVTGISRRQLLTRQTRHEYAPGRWMSDLDVLNAARLFDAEYPQLHEDVLSSLLADLAAARSMTVEAYAQSRLGLDGRSPLPDRLAAWLTEAELTSIAPDSQPQLVMIRVWPAWQSLDWRPAVLARLQATDRWAEASETVVAADEIAEETRFRLVVPPPTISGRLFLRHWQQPGSAPDVELARRGFTSIEDLGGTVRRFFAYDVQRGRR